MPDAPSAEPDTPASNPPAPAGNPVPFPIVRAVAVLGGVVLLVAAGVYLILSGLGRPVHAEQNLIAAAVCGGAGLVGLLPVWALSRNSSHGAAMGFMAGIVLRLFVAGGVVLGAQFQGYEHAQILSLWVAGWYLMVLMIEVKLVAGFALKHSVVPPA